MPNLTAKQQYNNNKLQKRLRRHVGQTIADFNMIEEGDRIMVLFIRREGQFCHAGYFAQPQASAPSIFELIAVNLDQKQPGFPAEVLPNYLDSIGAQYKIVEEDTYRL